MFPKVWQQNALEIFGDLYGTIDDKIADALSAAIAANRKGRRGRVGELRKRHVG